MNTVYCHSCQKTVLPVRPSPLWKLAVVATTVTLAAMVFGICLLGIGLLICAPLVAVFGVAIIPTVAEGAARLPYCGNPACGKYLTAPIPATAPRTALRAAAALRA